MNPIFFFVVAAAASVGISAWQQSAVNRHRERIATLSRELMTLRDAIHDDQILLKKQRGRLAALRQSFSRTDSAPDPLFAPTPDLEGWWPKDQPYFYFPKRHLVAVAFGKCWFPVSEANQHLTRQMQKSVPGAKVEITTPGLQESDVDFKLFEAGDLNPDAAAILGLSDAERAEIESLHAKLFQDVRALEAARVTRVPHSAGTVDESGRILIATLPNLTAEVQPLLAELERRLEQLLGRQRTVLLKKLARDYAEEYLDGLGLTERKFYRRGEGIYVDVGGSERWQPRTLTGQTGYSSMTGPLDYSHLFGPGAPGEIQRGEERP